MDGLNAGPLNSGLLATLALTNPAVDGYYSLEIIPFADFGSTPGSLDADDCRAEGGILTVFVGAIPPDISERSLSCQQHECGRIQIRYCQNDPNPEPLSNYITGPTNTNPTYVSGDTLRWYNAATGGSEIPEPDMASLIGSTGSTDFWVTQVDPATGCESANHMLPCWCVWPFVQGNDFCKPTASACM
ncbi:MAG: hypothetical protein R3B47_06915 [Bacteroidia bacterium]